MRIDGGACFVLVLALWPRQAPAALEPWFIGAGHSMTAENNLYRVPDGEARVRDMVSTTSLHGGLDQAAGRWRMAGSGSLRQSRYRNEATLDNDGYALQLKADGATLGHLSGGVEYARSRNLLGFNSSTDAALRLRNLETSEHTRLHGQLGLSAGAVSELMATASLSRRGLDYSAPSYASKENTQDVAALGLGWQPREALGLRIGLRETRGRYPQGAQPAPGRFQAESFERRDLDLGASWRATGASALDGRLSASRQQFDAVRQRDFSGATGVLSWRWQPTGKLAFTTTLSRDTGSEATFAAVNGVAGASVGDYGQVRSALDLQAAYAMTARLRFTAAAQRARRDLVNETVLFDQSLGAESGSDRLDSLSLALRYAPLRAAAVQCDLRRERRRADTDLSYPFAAKTASCELRITLQ
jgi:hypothetical protein